VVVIAFFAIAPVTVAQQADPVPPLLAQLASTDVTVRFAGFYALIAIAPASSGPGATDAVTQGISGLLASYPNDASQIIAALNQLLATENVDTARGVLSSGPNDETPGDFYGDVVEAVVVLNSPTSIPSLAGAITTGGMATTALASFGKAALPTMLPLVYSSDVQTRDAAAFTLVEMLRPQCLLSVNDAVSQSGIRAGLRRAISSFAAPSPYQYMAAPYQAALAGMPAVPVGDLNGDGLVNCKDVALIKASFGKSVGQAGFDIRADVNGDGIVNNKDLAALRKLAHRELECEDEHEHEHEEDANKHSHE